MASSVSGTRLDRATALEWYRQMVLIRRFEERAAENYARAKIGGYLHLYIGQEAVAVGAIAALRPDDHLVSHYRDHGHAIRYDYVRRAWPIDTYQTLFALHPGSAEMPSAGRPFTTGRRPPNLPTTHWRAHCSASRTTPARRGSGRRRRGHCWSPAGSRSS